MLEVCILGVSFSRARQLKLFQIINKSVYFLAITSVSDVSSLRLFGEIYSMKKPLSIHEIRMLSINIAAKSIKEMDNTKIFFLTQIP